VRRSGGLERGGRRSSDVDRDGRRRSDTRTVNLPDGWVRARVPFYTAQQPTQQVWRTG
jgi:hypothetical protein